MMTMLLSVGVGLVAFFSFFAINVPPRVASMKAPVILAKHLYDKILSKPRRS